MKFHYVAWVFMGCIVVSMGALHRGQEDILEQRALDDARMIAVIDTLMHSPMSSLSKIKI